jgi:putative oxygen-independent coproporphyrinogen III oxidase
MLMSDQRAGLYIHVPFCSAVCPYCDFAVEVGRADKRAAYVDALVAEARLCVDWTHPIDTVYFGGGTPSLLTFEQLSHLLAQLRQCLPIDPMATVFLEANPEDVSPDTAASWHNLGVRYLSLGVQSFDADELRTLGRRHTPEQAVRAVQDCMASGFDTVSVDLMFGLPGQLPERWQRSLQTVVALGPPHVSCYQLTVHEGTTFGRWRDRGKLVELPEEGQADLFDMTHHVLAQGGWCAYEVSNFARAVEHQSAHNMKYWSHTPYLGLGPSAHSFDGNSRWWNERSYGQYAASLKTGRRPVDGVEMLTNTERALETVMLRLRAADGIDLVRFERDFGVDLVGRNRAYIDASVEDGLLEVSAGRLRPTLDGLAVADGMAAALRLD